MYCYIIIDAIKLLNAELAEMDASNYKTNWMVSYLKDFAEKTEVPFVTLMKILRSILSGVKVNIARSIISIVKHITVNY